MEDAILIPPGKTQDIKCPEGTRPIPKAGSFLPTEGKDANFVVVSVSEQTIVLGPLKAGEITLNNICRDGDVLNFRIEAPDPQTLKKDLVPLGPNAVPYPLWLWAIPVLILLLLGALIYLIKRFADARKRKTPIRRVLRKRSPVEKMDDFIARVERELLLEKADIKSSQFIYAEGITCMRVLLQKGLGFKNVGATTTEFIGEFKSQLLKKPGLLNQAQVAKLESLFMQSKQVTYARENPDSLTKRAFFKLLCESYQDLKIKLGPLTAPVVAQRKRRIPIPKRSPKK